MSIKVKAIETDLSHFSDKDGKSLGFRFVLKPELYSKLTESKVIAEAALRSGVAKGIMAACWEAAGEVIKAWATEGHSVAIPGLGTMRFGLRSESVADVNDVATKMITSRRIVFTPSVGLKQELKQTSIAITCYDKDGNIIKRVTSDAGEVEDPEDDTTNGGNENQNQGGSQNQNPSTGGGTTPTPTPNTDDGDEG
jgi:nucleoid DNA-binding protein